MRAPCSNATSLSNAAQRSLQANVSHMPKTEGDPLGPEFARRLRGEMDRIEPRFSSPRYLGASRRRVTWRLAPAALALSLVAILGLTAYAATGSPNPVVWTEDVV